MHPWRQLLTIFIITIIPAIVHSMIKGKQNTYRSKRTSRLESSNQMPKDGSQYLPEAKETKGNSKLPLTELPIHTFSTILRKINRYFYSCKKSKSDGILPLSLN
jgi:hypothetical protein